MSTSPYTHYLRMLSELTSVPRDLADDLASASSALDLRRSRATTECSEEIDRLARLEARLVKNYESALRRGSVEAVEPISPTTSGTIKGTTLSAAVKLQQSAVAAFEASSRNGSSPSPTQTTAHIALERRQELLVAQAPAPKHLPESDSAGGQSPKNGLLLGAALLGVVLTALLLFLLLR